MENWQDIIEPIYGKYESNTLAQISAFSKIIGYELPKDYADFLSKYGVSGFFEKSACITRENSSCEIEVFYGLTSDTHNIPFYWEDEEYQKHALLPIGANGFGHPFLINLKNHKIYFIERSPFYAEAEEMADSFTDFLCNLVFGEND